MEDSDKKLQNPEGPNTARGSDHHQPVQLVKLEPGADDPSDHSEDKKSCDSTNNPTEQIQSDNSDLESSANSTHNKGNPNHSTPKTPSDQVVRNVKTAIKHLTRNLPKLEKDTWKKYNKEFSDISKDAWNLFKKSQSTPEQFVTDINVMLASFLETKPEFQRVTREFCHHKPMNEEPVEEIRKRKVTMNKEARKINASEETKVEALI